ncbi:hypothetical protein [Embleya hyalina]|uniref:Uncharacterized protein n=1 Tax=Embleya hyalina TaxID=516124 RepID=A0A401Z468_9ACTN|nr:hypothetical protein [Embleya hyalina]GCE01638.1 hypothetical protein EHYA_09405 [Embleya hyalina]
MEPTASEGARENPWAWQAGRNPYRGTAFQILDLDPDLTGRAAIKAQVRKRRQRITRSADRFPVHGRVLAPAEVNAAEETLTDPAGRLAAELLTHRPERPGPDPGELAEEFAETEPPESAGPPRIGIDRRVLAGLVPPPAPREFVPLWTEEGAH